MKKILTFLAFAVLVSTTTFAQKENEDKSKRPSPPAMAMATTSGGTHIMISYGKPSVKGRTIGKDLEPMDGKIWRAGANEATVFEVNKDVKVEGKALPAGKYALFTIKNGNDWTFIFNKTWDTWGAYDYEKNKAEDALQVTVKGAEVKTAAEQLNYTVAKNGAVTLNWGTYRVGFSVK